MPEVCGTELNPDGTPQAGILIEVIPVPSTFIAADGSLVTGCATVRADDAGEWCLTLTPTEGATPDPSVYKVRRHISCKGCTSPQIFAIEVPDEAGPLDVEDLIVPLPDAALVLFCTDDPVALAALADPGSALRAARCDHVHPLDGIATDVEIAAAVAAEAALRAADVDAEEAARAAADTAHITDPSDPHTAPVITWTNEHNYQGDAYFSSGRPWVDPAAKEFADLVSVGADIGDGVVNGRAAWQAAVTYATSIGAVLAPSVPTNYYRVEPAAVPGTAISVTDDLRVIAPGRDFCKMKLGPESPTDNTIMWAQATGKTLILEGIHLEGQDVTGTVGTSTIVCTGVILTNGGTKASGSIYTRWCRIDKFDVCVKADGPISAGAGNLSTVLLDTQDTVVAGTGRGGGAIIHNGGTRRKVRTTVSNLTSGAVVCHAEYLAVHVALLEDDCDTNSTNGYGMHMFGGSAEAPGYVQINNSRYIGTFRSGEAAIITNNQAVTLISNTRFSGTNSGVRFRGDVRMVNCHSSGAFYEWQSDALSGSSAEIVDCVSIGLIAQLANVICTFVGGKIIGGTSTGVYLDAGTVIARAGTRFEGGAPTDAWIQGAGGNLRVDDIYIANSATVLGLELTNTCHVEGGDIEWADPTQNLMTNQSSVTGGFRLRKGLNPATLAAQTNLILNPNYDQHRITGAGTIDGIRITATSANWRLWLGSLYLIAEDTPGFSIGNGGSSDSKVVADAAATTQFRTRHLLHVPVPGRGWNEVE